MANLPKYQQRIPILRNLNDEHGCGNTLSAHPFTFKKFLSAVDPTPCKNLQQQDEQDPQKYLFSLSTPPSFVLAFTESLLNLCMSTTNAHYSAAAVGIIEFMYITVSTIIAKQIIEKGFAKPGTQNHYVIHQVHTQKIYSILQDKGLIWLVANTKKW